MPQCRGKTHAMAQGNASKKPATSAAMAAVMAPKVPDAVAVEPARYIGKNAAHVNNWAVRNSSKPMNSTSITHFAAKTEQGFGKLFLGAVRRIRGS